MPKLGDVENIYSDLLLHDMGPELLDTPAYGAFVAGADCPARRRPARRRRHRPGMADTAPLGRREIRPLSP